MRRVMCLDHGFAELVDSMGDDLSVVQAARVSTGSGTKGEEADKKLINYLMRHSHTSPFEQVTFKFHVKCPIFVARQWMRHRTWSYNEMSGRYMELPREFYNPSVWRAQDTANKQGSLPYNGDTYWVKGAYEEALAWCERAYQSLLDNGVARELARMVLPLSTYTEFYGTVNLHNLFRFLKLRLDSHAQPEIQVYAQALLMLITPIVPWSVEAWRDKETAR